MVTSRSSAKGSSAKGSSDKRRRPPARQTQKPPDPARFAALRILRAVEEDDAYANLVSGQILDDMHLEGRDAAFALNLAYGVLRWQGLLDAIWRRCTQRSEVDSDVQRVLRLGTHQLLQMQVPAHAAIATSVDLIRCAGSPGAAGFVNAVLRAVQVESLPGWLGQLGIQESTDSADQPQLDIECLALRWSHPIWIVEAFADALGSDRAELPALLAADNEPPRPVLVALPGLAEVAELRQDRRTSPGAISPLAAVLNEGRPDELLAVRQGRAAVQDEGSQLAALVLSRAPILGSESAWLDLCAGPGGKAAVLAGLAAERGIEFIAVEPQPARARLLRRRLEPFVQASTASRSATPAPRVLLGDGRHAPWGQMRFSRILVDAPCSGIGSLRRRPEARWRRTPDDLATLVQLQRELLDTAIRSTSDGGVVLYVTCSPHHRETVEVIEHALQTFGDAVRVLETTALIPELQLPPAKSVQLWPHRHGTDAMFMAALQIVTAVPTIGETQAGGQGAH